MSDLTTPTGPPSGVLSGYPLWVQALAWFGFPTCVAAFLLLQTAGWMPSLLQAHVVDTAAAAAIATRLADENRIHNQFQEQLMEKTLDKLTLGLRILCENNSRSIQERNNCTNIR